MPSKEVLGKARSAHNAIRHGLTCISLQHPSYRDDIYDVARMMCEEHSSIGLFEKAVQIAECDILIREIRSYRDRIIARLLDPYCYALTQANEERKSRLALHEILLAEANEIMEAVPKENATAEAKATFDEQVNEYFTLAHDRSPENAFEQALPDLVRLNRYERRAWSSRKRHFLHYMAIKAGYRMAKLDIIPKNNNR
jgi:hypothetical protein